MNELIRTIEIPRFDKAKLTAMFPGYAVTGDSYGWFYAVEETRTVLISYGWDSLISDVKNHLAGNGIKESLTIEMQMAHAMCQHVPQWCQEIRPEKEAKISAWKMMKKFYKAVEASWHLGQVDQAEAERRAAICATCPKNTDQLTEFCIGCHTRDLVVKMAGFIQSKSTSQDAKLKTCAACHCRLSLKVHFPLSVEKDPGVDFPDWCWSK